MLRGRLLRTGEEYNVRLGSQNVSRVTEALGTKSWKGHQLEVISVESFPGLARKGILFKGVKAAPQEAPRAPPPLLSAQSLEAVRKARDLIEFGIPLNEGEFGQLPAAVRAELLKLGLVERAGEGLYLFNRERCRPYLTEGS